MGGDVTLTVSLVATNTNGQAALRDLGIAWMNRGHGQLLLNNPTGDAAALLAYEQAIALLRNLPLAENPSWANSLGAACMNHGQLLHRVHGTARATDALAAFDAAEAALRPLQAADQVWPRRNLAGTLINRANLLLDLHLQAESAAIAREALARCAPFEATEAIDADLALKARRALCDALGHLLVTPGADQPALAAEASDAVDDAMALIRHWTARGATGFQLLAERFFFYGTQLYRIHQPHFLAEFLAENLPLAGQAGIRLIAREAIDAVLTARTRNILTMDDPATAQHLRTWRELEELRPRFLA